MSHFHHFLHSEDGAVTIDWVALTAGILLLGMAVVFGIYNNGVSELMGAINTELSAAVVTVVIGDAPSNLNP